MICNGHRRHRSPGGVRAREFFGASASGGHIPRSRPSFAGISRFAGANGWAAQFGEDVINQPGVEKIGRGVAPIQFDVLDGGVGVLLAIGNLGQAKIGLVGVGAGLGSALVSLAGRVEVAELDMGEAEGHGGPGIGLGGQRLVEQGDGALVVLEQHERAALPEQGVGIERFELQGLVGRGQGVGVVGETDKLLGQAQGDVGLAGSEGLRAGKLLRGLTGQVGFGKHGADFVTGVGLVNGAVEGEHLVPGAALAELGFALLGGLDGGGFVGLEGLVEVAVDLCGGIVGAQLKRGGEAVAGLAQQAGFLQFDAPGIERPGEEGANDSRPEVAFRPAAGLSGRSQLRGAGLGELLRGRDVADQFGQRLGDERLPEGPVFGEHFRRQRAFFQHIGRTGLELVKQPAGLEGERFAQVTEERAQAVDFARRDQVLEPGRQHGRIGQVGGQMQQRRRQVELRMPLPQKVEIAGVLNQRGDINREVGGLLAAADQGGLQAEQAEGTIAQDHRARGREAPFELGRKAFQRAGPAPEDVRQALVQHQPRHPHQRHPDGSGQGNIDHPREQARPALGVAGRGSEDEQEVAAEVAGAQGAQVIERQKGKAHAQAARAERQVQRRPQAYDQEKGVEAVEHAGDEFVASHRAARAAAPANRHKQRRQHRTQAEQQDGGNRNGQQEPLIDAEGRAQGRPEIHLCVVRRTRHQRQ